MLNRKRSWVFAVSVGVLLGATTLALRAADEKTAAPAGKTDMRYFEMRTYHAAPGKLDDLHARFRDHTIEIFKKHGMESIAYWTPLDKDGVPSKDTLVYILAYPSKDACDASWKAFREDPVWVKAKAESEKDGPLVEKVDSLFMNPTEFSPMK